MWGYGVYVSPLLTFESVDFHEISYGSYALKVTPTSFFLISHNEQ